MRLLNYFRQFLKGLLNILTTNFLYCFCPRTECEERESFVRLTIKVMFSVWIIVNWIVLYYPLVHYHNPYCWNSRMSKDVESQKPLQNHIKFQSAGVAHKTVHIKNDSLETRNRHMSNVLHSI